MVPYLESHAHIRRKYTLRNGIERTTFANIVAEMNTGAEDPLFSVALEYSRLPGYEISSGYLIPGEEVKTTEGHIIALGIGKSIPSFKDPYKTIEKIQEERGISIIPHPFSTLGLFHGKRDGDIVKFLESMRGPLYIEALNGWADMSDGGAREKTSAFIDGYNLSHEIKINPVGGSDARFGKEDLASTVTVLKPEQRIVDKYSLINALHEGSISTEALEKKKISIAQIVAKHPTEAVKDAITTVNNLASRMLTGQEISF